MVVKQDVIDTIIRFTDEKGYPPTYRELAVELGVSVSAAHRWVRVLDRDGRLRRTAGIARSIVVQQ